jgi:hypothetical protein
MGKAIQCPSCGRKHRVTGLPDAPTFHCEGCGQPLKIPSQFRPSVMASSRHVRPPDSPRPESTAVLPKRPAAAAALVAASAPAAARPRTPARPVAAAPATDEVSRPLRILAWVVALVLGLVITLWVARITGWLSGNRLVDVFLEEGWKRYIRIIAIAPVWAMFTTLLLTLFLEGGKALARRRAEKRAAESDVQRRPRRGSAEPLDYGDGGRSGDDRRVAAGRESKRTAARRGGP